LSMPGQNDLVEALSERELSVLRLLSQGKTNQEIAGEMFLSINTVKSHLKNIYGKLDASNRREAVSQARIRSLLPDYPPAALPSTHPLITRQSPATGGYARQLTRYDCE